MLFRKYPSAIILCIIGALFLFSFYNYNQISYLRFSDGAKFADIGRNIAEGIGYGSSFTRYSNNLQLNHKGLFSADLIPPLVPYLNALMFTLFGASDSAVIIASSLLYILLIVLVFILGKKYWGNLVGLLAAIAVASNTNFLDYATTGASEMLFSVEIILSIYLFSLRKRWSEISGIIVLIFLYLTRAQAPFFIVPIILYFIYLKTESFKKTIRIMLITIIAFLVFVVVGILSPEVTIFSTLRERVIISLIHNSTLAPADEALRMGTNNLNDLLFSNITVIFNKLFYNLYNFYKLLPQIASPYLWGLFIIGLFRWGKNRTINSLKMLTLFMVIITFFITAVTIPFFRYLHPVVPLVYLFATATLVWVVREMVDDQWVMMKKWPIVSRLKKEALVVGICSFLIFFFVAGQSLGVIFLDSRFKAARTNQGKPPVYVHLSRILRDNTDVDDVTITNLDTWGSWYGERKTVWFPLKPNQLNIEDSGDIRFDAIYLTSYLMNDENYYMGNEWRDIFFNPKSHNQQFIKDNYEYVGEFNIPATETYENIEGKAVLFTQKR